MTKDRKHRISSDESLNEPLAEQVSSLRGSIVDAAEQDSLPGRFHVTADPDAPSMDILDTATGRTANVPLFAYRDVRRVLNDLFE